MYLDPERPGAEDLLDQIVSGVRSSFTYAGARTIGEFHSRAVVGLQSSAGYDEGRPSAHELVGGVLAERRGRRPGCQPAGCRPGARMSRPIRRVLS